MRQRWEKASEDWLNDSYDSDRKADRSAGEALMAARFEAMTFDSLLEDLGLEKQDATA